MDFIKNLHLEMNAERLELLNARQERQQAYDKGRDSELSPRGRSPNKLESKSYSRRFTTTSSRNHWPILMTQKW